MYYNIHTFLRRYGIYQDFVQFCITVGSTQTNPNSTQTNPNLTELNPNLPGLDPNQPKLNPNQPKPPKTQPKLDPNLNQTSFIKLSDAGFQYKFIRTFF